MNGYYKISFTRLVFVFLICGANIATAIVWNTYLGFGLLWGFILASLLWSYMERHRYED